MNIKIVIAVFLLSLLALKSYSANSEVHIDLITPSVSMENDLLLIKGKGFGQTKENVSVKFRMKLKVCQQNDTECKEYEEYDAIVSRVTDTEIDVRTPAVSEKAILKVRVDVKDSNPSNEVEFGIYWQRLVDQSITLKKSGMNDPAIVDHLYFQSISSDGATAAKREGVFGNIKLNAEDISKLKSNGFNEEYIAKLEGQKQYVTLGVGGIWLNRTSELVAAPMIRILLVPRGYFYEREDYWGEWSWGGRKWPRNNLYWVPKPQGIVSVSRWDLNIGATSSASTGTDSTGQKTNYVLFGLSHEINIAAFINVGIALSTDNTKGIKKQFYWGVTVDSNFLKAIGIMNK
jgi:hypothetical protein